MFRNKKLSYKNPLYCDNEKSPWNKYYYYYPVKIFFRFWLAKIPCTIHCPRWAKSRGDILDAARVCRKEFSVEICCQPLKKKISICLIRGRMESLSKRFLRMTKNRLSRRMAVVLGTLYLQSSWRHRWSVNWIALIGRSLRGLSFVAILPPSIKTKAMRAFVYSFISKYLTFSSASYWAWPRKN